MSNAVVLLEWSQVEQAFKSLMDAYIAELRGQAEAPKAATPKFYTFDEACEIARISRPTGYRLELNGTWTFQRMGNKKLISEEELTLALGRFKKPRVR